jgi:hypothetical protein
VVLVFVLEGNRLDSYLLFQVDPDVYEPFCLNISEKKMRNSFFCCWNAPIGGLEATVLEPLKNLKVIRLVLQDEGSRWMRNNAYI